MPLKLSTLSALVLEFPAILLARLAMSSKATLSWGSTSLLVTLIPMLLAVSFIVAAFAHGDQEGVSTGFIGMN